MPLSFLVVDDFLGNAAQFRESALKLDYPYREGEYFPGRNSVERLPIPGLEQVVSSIVQEPLRAVHPPGSHGKVRVALASEADVCEKLAGQRSINERLAKLTPREREVLDLLVTAHSTKEIASRLQINAKTVFVHRARVMEKMGADNLVELSQMVTPINS